MAFGLAGASGSFQANMAIVGGIVTGSSGEFLALPISSTVLGGLSGLETNEWSRFYLSDSFGAASASVVQALNFLKTTADAGGGDVTGPASSNNNAIVRFDGTGGKTVQNTAQVLISDAGAISSSVTAHFVDGITGKLVAVSSSVSGAGNVAGQSANLGAANNFKVGIFGALSSSTTAHFVDGITGKLLAVSSSVSGAGGFAGQSLAFGANGAEFAVSVAGLANGGAGGDSYQLAANGQISGANAVIAGTNVSGAGSILGGAVSVGNGAGTISVAGAFVGASFSGQSALIGNIKSALGGHISASVASSVQFSNTGSAGGNNYKAAMLISSSDIQGAGDAALIPRMVMQGTDDAGALKDFMVSVSGGMLQVVELTYGNALPI